MNSTSYYSYWGKADTMQETYHLLPYHCLDVAAVGWVLMHPEGKLCRRLSSQLRTDPKWLQHWFTFLLMLHDIGKFARAFQNLVPNLSSALVAYHGQCIYQLRHDSLGYLLWRTRLKDLKSACSRNIDPWMEVVCGHHGQPPKSERRGFESHFLNEDFAAVESYVQAVNEWWHPDFSPLAQIDKQVLRSASWQLAGVAVLADWLGSSRELFKYCREPMPLDKYWNDVALVQAPAALDLVHWEQSLVAPFEGIHQQFPFIKTPTSLQRFATEQPLKQRPQLFILEDITGAGKTEAAMVLAHRLMAQGEARGLYVALPSMATANAMYERLAKSYRALFGNDITPSLILAHGAANLSDDFVDTITFANQQPDHSYQTDDVSASAYCNAWLADNRKKALLAEVGVGTVDQALLGVLPARHQSLRLLGLADKVLLVDEVHAYDPYMRVLLVALLEMHARQGGSAILLSATLPQSFRTELAHGFAKGLGCDDLQLSKPDYPLATHLSVADVQEKAIDSRAELYRRVEVVRLEHEAAVIETICQAVEQGRAVCWIRNTVGDARSAYETVANESWCDTEKLTLFHSRFAMVDRQRIERDVVSRFGKDSDGYHRNGQVLIATQVVEQSLDLDFDIMVTDLAPVDLLIQRAGRLQRHTRNADGKRIETGKDRRASPCLYILAPDPTKVDDEQWLKRLLLGTQAVYQNVGQLWLTLSVLLEQNGFRMPEDARRLIEGVYGEEAQERIPEALQELTWQAHGVGRSQHGMGEFNRLKLNKGYTRLSGDWDEEVRTPTRLGDDSITVALARVVEGEFRPYADTEKHAWALSQIALPKYDWERVQKSIDAHWLPLIEKLHTDEPALRWCEVLPLDGEILEHYDPDGGWNRNRREQRELDKR
ncbi:MAG: CRISPR-associated helicase Cas3' [Candidatus Marinimicrobia bacterium]|nr:CRISPR-associated helicase Cas3' [Candidatus Neomarinimicrobiota bacterium]MCF7851032.1 CRISPR-associated helicase Cas3' [Candidatus Neomarinimicrobiota bacterium]